MKIPNGFIKDSHGVYRRGSYILKEGQIVKETEKEEIKQTLAGKDLDTLIREVLSGTDTLPNNRTVDVYIKSKGEDGYEVTDKMSDKVVAIITPENNVFKTEKFEAPTTDETKELKSSDKNNAKEPKEIKKIEKVKAQDTDKVLKESSDDEVSISKLTDTAEYLKALIDGLKERGMSSIKCDYTMPHVTCLSFPGYGYLSLTSDVYDLDLYLGESSLKEAEVFNQEKFAKLVKQANDLELEQFKAATTPEDISAARMVRNTTIDQILKTTDLNAPTEEEIKARNADESLNQQVPEDTPEEEIHEDEEPKETPKEKGMASFIYQPSNIDVLKDKTEKHLVTPASYIILHSVTLDESKYNEFTKDMHSAIEELSGKSTKTDEADFGCIEIRCQGSPTLLVDTPSSNGIAKYVAFK